MTKQNPIGFIKLHRKIIEWGWYSDTNTFRLFMHLLLTANYEDKQWLGLTIKRGQLAVGRKELAKSTHLSEMQIRTSLSKLKSTNEITIKTTNRFSIIEVVNYNLYQDNTKVNNQQDNQENNNPITNKQPTDNQQITTTKEVKKIKKGRSNDKIFIPPTLDEIKSYCLERESLIDAEYFFNFYNSNDWKDSNDNPVKNWKQKFITWDARDKKTTNPKVVNNKPICEELNNFLGKKYFQEVIIEENIVFCVCSEQDWSGIVSLPESKRDDFKALVLKLTGLKTIKPRIL